MSQRLVSPRFLATTALLVAGAGLIGLACGSDDDPAPVVPSGGSPSSGGAAPTGNGGSTATPIDEPPGAGGANTTPVASGGSEGVPPNIPVDPTTPPPEEPGMEPTPPPPSAGLQPNCNPPEGTPPTLALELVAGNLDNPLLLKSAPGDDTRLFVVEQGGVVRVLVNGELAEQPFIDISGQVTAGGERGLLGLAFHPQYATNGLFYLHYSASQANSSGRISEFTVDAANRSAATAASQRDVLTIPNDPEPNHNGGDITFGADGFLYIGMGDGGGGNDNHGPVGNGQNLQTLYGKLLRIDVDGRDVENAYSIPPNNLAAQTGQQALPEIWAYGLRNPWRFSFDACTQDLYIADVGQNTLEEIDFLPAAALAGTNFGWRFMEGPNCRPNDADCAQVDQSTLTLPVDSYPRTVGQSVTGGYVYRGSAVPGLRGRYIYADYASARFFSFRMENGALAERQEITAQMQPAGGGELGGISSFGQDNAGEVYVAAFEPGAIYRIVAAP